MAQKISAPRPIRRHVEEAILLAYIREVLAR
jgi:hypothetical protein